MTTTKQLCEGIIGCDCGKDHLCPIDSIIIGNSVLPELYNLCSNYNNILLVADSNTYNVCGKKVLEILDEKISDSIIFETPDFVLIPDEVAVEKIDNAVSNKTDIIIGVGSKVISMVTEKLLQT